MDHLSDKILKNYLLGKCTPKELEELDLWVSASDEHAKWLFDVEKLYHSGKNNKYADPVRIRKAEDDLFKRILQEKEVRSERHRLSIFRYAAAIAILCIIGGFVFYQNNKIKMIQVLASEDVMEIMLPDSSKVWLNKGSVLSYPEIFQNGVRSLSLNGEATFEVTHNPEKPFVVSSENLRTKVLGTIFNFRTNADDNHEEVTLLEGKVEVCNLMDKGRIILKPDQKLVLDKREGNMGIENVYSPLSTTWHDHLIPFNNMHLKEIASILETIYNVQFIIQGSDENATYTGEVKQAESIEKVLNDLSYTIPFTVKKVRDKLFILESKEKKQ